MRAFGYIRVSTNGQAADGVSLDAQRARIRAWCAANGYEVPDTFTDSGVSAKRADNRAGLQDALDEVCKKPGAALVVYSLSRLARSTKDAIAIAERLDKAGADLVSLSERIDTTTAAGKMVFRMLAVMAEFERDLVSERTKTALQHMRSNGQRVGSIPYGYDLAGDGVTLTENPTEQRTIRSMRHMRANGLSFERIAKVLTDRKVPTKTGRSTRWGYPAVRRILSR